MKVKWLKGTRHTKYVILSPHPYILFKICPEFKPHFSFKGWGFISLWNMLKASNK